MYLNVDEVLVLRKNEVIAVATTLKPIIPPTRNKYLSGRRDVRSEHIPKYSHHLVQRSHV